VCAVDRPGDAGVAGRLPLCRARRGDPRWPTLQRHLPPSATVVHYVLGREDDLTQGDPVERPRLSTRTVRDALRKLEAADAVVERGCPRDARTRVYSIAVN
jgi:DNA-binding MarR family transcriptional regulator